MVDGLGGGVDRHRARADRRQRRFDQRERARVAFQPAPGAAEVARHALRVGEAADRMHAGGQRPLLRGGAQRAGRLRAAAMKHQHAIERALRGQRGAHRPDLVVANRQHDGVGAAQLAQGADCAATADETHGRMRGVDRAGQHIVHLERAGIGEQAAQHPSQVAGADDIEGARHPQNLEPGWRRKASSSALDARPRIALRCGKRPKRAMTSRCRCA